MAKELIIAGVEIKPGEEKRIEMPSVHLYTDTPMPIPVFVKRGKKDGPILLVSAAVHGDELNGIEIISRLINSPSIKNLKGTLIAVPIVNVYGVLSQSRYMPDRRDLNRSFPGSSRGSLAGRIAKIFLNEIVTKCDYGIDLHTGAIHRSNLPQIRADLSNETTKAMAYAFGVPVLLNADIRDGSLRESAASAGVNMLLYEAGEALRFDELSIRAGVKGIINVMRHLDMLRKTRSKKPLVEPFVAHNSTWVRATDSGVVSHKKSLGDYVEEKDELAVISDPYGKTLDVVKSPVEGIIIGKQNIPLVQEGEAMYHIAFFKQHDGVLENLGILQDNLTVTIDDNNGF
ncbi:succinylglutamate desuccinylase/aspartoacylase family protein [Dasania sp. GY-MA-18]|uniref:Succinylglutamate desuccinylase/aspartoacylase family protein n=1 Tax=Dasania phycosphaerae TaxID=2950436 RepID=A0A9J6RLJ1_9GAMM|nr:MULTISPECIES: succinylglutamate desuccinylase/aspartoacylase family protein [Dasania]MCR8922940.1 succinylglutamate desuccinylase/aspartoacylase family protein [Dasania sp. GY-MA-18]MCZ0865371.1 succinylglutamate desuccinylase/aspartoacylase family protein [Dasania phycosphaerae]MCZ0869096.1 succinylglutamate desuccinylase/aspartoacylase family protein [Dasania phycosphaerae]